MRITNGMIRNNSINSLYTNMGRLDTLFNQMNTLKKIQRPSDDPIVAGRGLKLRINVMEIQQHQSNVDEASSWMSVTEAALSNMTEIVKEIRTKAVQAANGTLTPEDRTKISNDIQQLYKQLEQEANTTYAGRYVFSGYKTDQPVFDKDGNINTDLLEPNLEGHHIEYEIGVGTTIEVNTLGVPDLMMDIRGDIENMLDKLQDPDTTDEELGELFTDMIGALDDRLGSISEKTSSVGSRMARLDYTQTRLTDNEANMTELLSKTEDIDIEDVYVQFNIQYMVYQSALQATSKVVMNTLADFLR